MPKTFYITTAIDYTNSPPHIGHAYEKILADVIARYHRLKGEEVFFLTGVDQHGQKVQQSAEKKGVEPQEFVDEITAKFVALWKKLEVDYTGWAATTAVHHKENVRYNLQVLWDDKDPATGESRWLYKKTQRGFYSVRQEQFLTDKERNEQGEFGPEWQPVEEREEENFYFRLTQDRGTGAPGFDPKRWLLDFIDKRSRERDPFVIPDFRLAELRHAVEKLDGDLCISRPASRLRWGIPFPESFGMGFVTYVWFDALLNYLTFVPGHDPHFGERSEDLGQNGKASSASPFQEWWKTALHVIGKDILIPAHGVYWPIMLKAIGYPDDEIPTLLVHGWWNLGGAKMSKSAGNVIDPFVLADKYSPEAVRFYLMSDIATGKDADFSEERLVERYNADLANNLGNLLNRTLNMIGKYLRATLAKSVAEMPTDDKPPSDRFEGFEGPTGTVNMGDERVAKLSNAKNAYRGMFDTNSISYALTACFQYATGCNQLIDYAAPWKLATSKAKERDLCALLYHLAESLRIIAILISPVLPKAAHGIFDQFNWKMELSGKEERFSLADAEWGKFPDGHVVGKPVPLFPRIER